MIKNKRGDVWVSAVIYFGLGMILLTLLLSAGTPVINRLRDKNIALQTKEVLQVLDANIREVAREGPGSQRPIVVDMRKGEFKVDADTNTIKWVYKTTAILTEPCKSIRLTDTNKDGFPDDCASLIVKEGTVNQLTTGVKGDYTIAMSLAYPQIYLVVPGPTSSIIGRTDLIIRNDGLYCIDTNGKKIQKTGAASCTTVPPKIGIVISPQS